ncbi:MAG: FGGY family carbohydrate kinase [Kineosporiaceae bacterium]
MSTASELVLGIDVGTSSVKVVARPVGDGAAGDAGAATGATGFVARVPVPWTRVPTGAEIDPGALADAVVTALDRALAPWQQDPGIRVTAVGLASFAESVALLDAAGRPVAPMLAWFDERGDAEAPGLAGVLGDGEFETVTGLPVSGLCSAATVRSLAGDTGLDRVATVLSAADWVAVALGGTPAFDLTLASRTGWLDLAARAWLPGLASWTGLRPGALPSLAGPAGSRGRVPPGRPGVPAAVAGAEIVVAGMDHLVAAVGAGAGAAGTVWDSCGTAEAFLRSTPPLPRDVVRAAVERGYTVGWHAEAPNQVVLGALRSGYVFERVLRLLGVSSAEDLARFEAAAARPAPGASLPLVEEPYGASYALRRLTSATAPGEVWWSLVDRVATDGEALVAGMDDLVGPHDRVVTGGGWAASGWFDRAKRARHRVVERCAVAEPGAHGAALLALRTPRREGQGS